MRYTLIATLVLFFASCSQQEPKKANESAKEEAKIASKPLVMSPEDSAKYLELGDDLVSTSKQVISTALVDAIEKGGVKYAASFCNVAAYPIIDSLSMANGAQIRRVSDKPRNPKDAMDEEELKVFSFFKAKFAQPESEVVPVVMQTNDSTISFYKPIKISMPTCLKCHGEVGKEVNKEDYKILKTLYPNDDAVGYKQGDLRGMFSIRFIKTHTQTH